MRSLLIALFALTVPAVSFVSAQAQVSIGISIGVNVPAFPNLVAVPGYPVYYDPSLDSNYFFYDGQYWVYDSDNWYTSDWYNGPWDLVEPDYVPVFILRVPVRYYRQPPPYFGGWQRDAPPRWEEHWGRDWESHHHGWNRWDHQSAPRPAPLPVYQRQYSGDRYPHPEQQHSIRDEHYRYQPREPAVQHIRQEHRQSGPTQRINQPTNRDDSVRREVPPRTSQPQPLPEQSPDIQRRLQKPNNAPKPPAGLHRPPVNRPESPPPVRVERSQEHRPEAPPQPQREHAPSGQPTPPHNPPRPKPREEKKAPAPPHHDD